ncbi:MAG: hypothetical protein E7671_00110 [Ruminococcaceae bacterium]|nr:hypothetical protein [Oscillospiraceae bacterium]
MNFSAKKIKELFFSSAIIRFSKKCYDAMLSGFFGSMLTNYSSHQRRFEEGVWGGDSENVGSWRDSRISRLRRRAIVSYENSKTVRLAGDARSWLLGCQMKFYGFFFMYFGISVLLMNLIKRFSFSVDISSGIAWFVGALLIAAAFPMLVSSKTLAFAVVESFVFSTLIFDVLGFPRASLKKYSGTEHGSKRYFWATLVGALLGCTSYFVSPVYIILGIVFFIGAGMIYKSPEIGIIVSVFIAPFLTFIGSPSLLLALFIIYTAICVCIKVFLGKLRPHFEISDMFVALFMFVMLMGGAVSVGGVASLKEASIYVCFMFIYFMTVSLITSTEWLGRLVASLVASGTLTALYGLYQKISGNLEVGTMDKDMFEGISGRITSTFENSNMLGVFLIIVIPFALSLALRSGNVLVKLLSLASCAIMGVCLIYTWSRGAWLGLVLAVLVFMLLYDHYIIPVAVPLGALGLTLFADKLGGGLFDNLIKRFSSILMMSDSSSVYRLGIWRGSMKVALENWFTGIGVGAEAFRAVYIRFAESGIETAVHSHNLFLQMMIETGVVGLMIFLASLVLCIKSGLEVIRRGNRDTGFEKVISVAGISALMAALLQGMTDFIWFNYRIFFFFWVVVAVISASSRIARKRIYVKSEY